MVANKSPFRLVCYYFVFFPKTAILHHILWFIANIFGIFTSVIDLWSEVVNKIFWTVKNALKLPFSDAVANNSKQGFLI